MTDTLATPEPPAHAGTLLRHSPETCPMWHLRDSADRNPHRCQSLLMLTEDCGGEPTGIPYPIRCALYVDHPGSHLRDGPAVSWSDEQSTTREAYHAFLDEGVWS